MSDSAPRVLLVEDDEGDALLVTEALAEAGLPADHVDWQRTLDAGVRALVHRPDAVLLDLGLPDAEGLSAVHGLVAAAGDTPVIVLTGRQGRVGIEAVGAGAQDYLVKDDISADLLDRSIRYAVQRKRAQETELALRAQQLLTAENSRLERGLLPKPRLRTDLVACATHYRPGREAAVLGGDFFDVVETPDGRIRAVIGDVMGHGPDEAAIGVHLRVAWRTLVLAGTPDEEILLNLSRLLSAESGGVRGFVTACDITIDSDLTLTARVAGHPAPMVCRDGQTSYLDVEVGPPLGVEGLSALVRKWSATGGWPQTRARLGAGASLILYTDGLLESYRVTTNESSIGADELAEATGATVARGGSPEEWIPALVGGAPARSDDDTAVVVITTRADA